MKRHPKAQPATCIRKTGPKLFLYSIVGLSPVYPDMETGVQASEAFEAFQHLILPR